MPNYKQAPKLFHDKSHFEVGNFYMLPQELMDSVFQQLEGKCGNQIKLITVLLGTLGNGSFGVSEKWILERTGMIHETYMTARKALVKRGWVALQDGEIFVLPTIIKYGFHYPEGASEEEKEKCREEQIQTCLNKVRTSKKQG